MILSFALNLSVSERAHEGGGKGGGVGMGRSYYCWIRRRGGRGKKGEGTKKREIKSCFFKGGVGW